ncbi:MAG: PilT/PilU family type 4a pilus ATPase [Deltaproteobacteria bacterium]|nr:PilT/PilU family type 4a pilus ATPase [Deltaproteobacteria bacterium]NND28075.1 PilT/PilU family type 4a pilus ATPase [Myxococcales bacterium]MBT8465842.1 PilT/PilU family type 4a pilus ATPase [Deltaproteobacteria bacterium]MBT8483565.1 PilT/PilU family type 4a pilus ATPase [Deltaproteobacteria bacterium]NNK08629.1 PilT/PilU family type 4a pilus ATPase [Myxococcales bacterium]
MSQLREFLKYLDRDDVTEIVFQSGAAATAKKRGKARPVTGAPMSARHILKLLRDTPLQSLVPSEDGASAATSTLIDGAEYIATAIRSGQMLLLRVRRAGRSTEPPGAPIGAVAPLQISVPADAVEQKPAVESYEPPPMPEKDRATLGSPAAVPAPRVAAPSAEGSYRTPAEAEALGEFIRSDLPVPAPAGLRALLLQARDAAASDVHIMSGEPPRLRKAGRLSAVGPVLSDDQARGLVMPLLSDRSAKQLNELGYADFACQLEGVGRLRVNVNEQRSGIKGCFRLIMAEPPTLESLGLPSELRQMLSYHQGLVVVSGPNGAGKTTTLSALVDLFNSERSVHIITVEDPVEVIHPIKKAIVSQREVGIHTRSFHSALKGSLREDPDVIAIGELRDRETVEKALEAAETGHLVFATMSTPSGARTIGRLIDMFPPDDQSQVRSTLAGVLKFVVSQRLVPRKDGNGRVVAVELLTGGMALWTLIRDDKLFQLPSLLQRGRAFGMIRIEDSLNELVSSGVIALETAKKFAEDPRLLGRASKQPVAPPQASSARGVKGTMRNVFSKKGS